MPIIFLFVKQHFFCFEIDNTEVEFKVMEQTGCQFRLRKLAIRKLMQNSLQFAKAKDC